ncbi:MAG: 30S ribosomal protein S16 [Bacteroidales bacterium]|nr:30S ribosomal protein S16 [Bacteroidales bacterium]
MAVRIRLQRHGKKNQPFYHIVIADARAARDGRFIEKIGTYNPLTSPATVVVDADKACTWMKNGAQPTDTVRSLFSYKGIMLKYHLQRGVEKGAFTQEVADKRLADWMKEKEQKIAAKIAKDKDAKLSAKKEALKAEADVNAKRAEAIAKKREEAAAKPVEETTEAAEAPATEEAPAEE